MLDAAFPSLFAMLTGNPSPFPWQEALFCRFMEDVIPDSLDIPTGLGKTAVMAIWLAARAKGAKLPRRLVYIVDRRAVVDQATEVAEALRAAVDRHSGLKEALGLATRSLPISTLRGKHVDNREWLEDPALPSIILGTIDMIGSRLLFGGYGVSRKMRPYHAGLLGADALFVLDEAHLVPPFERLLERIASGCFGPKAGRNVPALRLMSLSATGRARSGQAFTLDKEDLEHEVVKRRLEAEKRLELKRLDEAAELSEALAKEAWALTEEEPRPRRVIVYCNERKVAENAKKKADKEWKGKVETELFVGGRRIHERGIAEARLKELGFIAGSEIVRDKPAFVFATSAGEVGVDLDADDMVSDLVEWDRMVQRLGRVNRRGNGKARVRVLLEAELDPLGRVREQALRLLSLKEGCLEASPGAIREVKHMPGPTPPAILAAASTPEPLRPELARPVVEAWTMTSLEEHTGRPDVAPWLRGWIEADYQTTVVWRTHLPTRLSEEVKKKEIEDFFEAAPPRTSEGLETETVRVQEWLKRRASKCAEARTLSEGEVVAFVFSKSGDLRRSIRLGELLADSKDEKDKERLRKLLGNLYDGMLVVDARLGGLKDGLLDNGENSPATTLDFGTGWTPPPPFFVRRSGEEPEERKDRRIVHRFVKAATQDGEATEELLVEKQRGSTNEASRAVSTKPQLLEDHQRRAEEVASDLAGRLGLEADQTKMLRISARLHDEGKKSPVWQQAFNAPRDGRTYAKTSGPVSVARLGGYRHEFRSMLEAKGAEEFKQLPESLQDLGLHLIAAHHGYARPVIGTGGWDYRPPSDLDDLAREVAERFARLQREWGPWGLAWWESLLRSVDAQASRENDEKGGA